MQTNIPWFTNSTLFELARRGQRLTHIALVVPMSLVIPLVSQFAAIPVILVMFLRFGNIETLLNMKGVSVLEAAFWMSAQLVSSFIFIYIILWFWLYLFEKRPFWTLGYKLKNAAMQYGRGFLFGALMFAGAVAILAAFGSVQLEQGDPSAQGFPALGAVPLVLIGWIVQGGAEEVLMRGWALPVIGARTRPWIGLLVSSVLFALLHLLNPGLSVIAMVNLALFGVFAGLYAMREGSLWGISALHAVWNWVQGNFFGFEVSGTTANGGTVFNLMETGADWLTGGSFGPEGGVAVTLVLVLGTAFLALWPSNPPTETSAN
ncbi:MAG: CPBP family intramembrane metalloprotease [Chloroflexi bacterium]|nr:CPBP family intramembrane metalloprotease [Chloroflexota bacterium]